MKRNIHLVLGSKLWVGTIILFPFSATGGPCLNTELKPVDVKSAARQVVLIGAN